MEKLILRSIMWGADKIPDTWFEKVPGGYYKAKEEAEAKAKKAEGKPASSGSGGGDEERSRRHSMGDTSRRPSRIDTRDEGYRSDGPRRRRQRDNQRDSYDGPDDDYYSGDDRHRRRNHGSYRPGRTYDDDQRYGHEDEYGRPSRYDRQKDRRTNGTAQSQQPTPDRLAAPLGAATAGAYFGTAGTQATPYPQSNLASLQAHYSQPAANGTTSVANGYVPYADIYGHPASSTRSSVLSPPPQSNNGSVKPNETNRLGHPVAPQTYYQNPYAQDGATSATASAGAAYSGHANHTTARYEDDYNSSQYDHHDDDRYLGYDDTGRPYSLSPNPHGRSKRNYSPSFDSYNSRDHASRRARSARHRAEDEPIRSKSQGGRGKSGLREAFDTSQRGLGYGAFGAIAGGLFASEFAEGPIPIAIGATVGALGANAYEARERYVPPGYDLSGGIRSPPPPTGDPRKPFNTRFGADGMPPPSR
ncbi:hypothetical protein BAUCODRAFT_556850 [Baudoinia panamericana UAMH 10762]|uniref:Uncharacterized protein n=1 Tax=Baudoinia panamericana (strain UAMH 10762) TaxID=717646 RepID=M2LKB0_BAUPA|nr:uncharacterized protein BAUCODRAFT_556850 [Baudoinia panamericana UAMH 10762]EMC94697.1 hypothetical protein BAUCODRAFT_556850 [Baudoinia panamericana UAMH 10762]